MQTSVPSDTQPFQCQTMYFQAMYLTSCTDSLKHISNFQCQTNATRKVKDLYPL